MRIYGDTQSLFSGTVLLERFKKETYTLHRVYDKLAIDGGKVHTFSEPVCTATQTVITEVITP